MPRPSLSALLHYWQENMEALEALEVSEDRMSNNKPLVTAEELASDDPPEVVKTASLLARTVSKRANLNESYVLDTLLGYGPKPVELAADAITGDYFSPELNELCNQWLDGRQKTRIYGDRSDKWTIRTTQRITGTPTGRAEANAALNDPTNGGHRSYQELASETARILDSKAVDNG